MEVIVLTWSNVGDKLIELADMIKKEGMPTPEKAGLDNTKIFADGLTNYTWALREAYKILGYVANGMG